METIHGFSYHRHLPISKTLQILKPQSLHKNLIFSPKPSHFYLIYRPSSKFSALASASSWFSGLGLSKKAAAAVAAAAVAVNIPEIVKAGDPVLHEPAGEVAAGEIGSEGIQKIVDDMVAAMRRVHGVGLAAPQIGVPLRIIALEDTKEYISYAPKKEIEAQDRCPFDLLFF